MDQLFSHFKRGLKTVYLTLDGICIVATYIKESQPSKNVGLQFACSKNGLGVGSMTLEMEGLHCTAAQKVLYILNNPCS